MLKVNHRESGGSGMEGGGGRHDGRPMARKGAEAEAVWGWRRREVQPVLRAVVLQVLLQRW